MKKYGQGLFKAIAMRGIVVAIPVAMASAYASNLFVPVPPRMAAYEYQQVAEITTTPSTVGIAASTLYGQTKAQIDTQLDEMQALGVENIRVFVPWGLIELNPVTPTGTNQYYWDALDTVMQAAKERNMGVLAEINSTPYWGAADGNTSYSGNATPNVAAYAAFVSDLAAKYGDIVSAYEIWNEPNGITFSNPIDPAAYAALVKAAYQAIKPVDPTATVIAGAVGHVITFGNYTMDPVDFVKAMIAADPTIGQYFDALSYHPYDESLKFSAGNLPSDGSWASDTAYNQVKDLMALFPTKKVWLTEFGVPTYSYTYTDANGVIQTVAVTQAQQDALIKDLIQTWQNISQAGPVFLYTGRDTDTGNPISEYNYGIWDENGNPKLVAAFLAQWFKDHPQGSTSPTTPGTPAVTPANPLAALFAAIAAQVNAFVAQWQAAFTTFVQAIANFFGSLGGAAVTPAAVTSVAATASLRVASAAASDTSAELGDKASVTVETDVTSATKSNTEIAPAVDVVPAAETSSTVDVPAASTTPKAEAAPAVEAPAVAEVEKAPVIEPVAEVVEPEAEPVVTKTPEVTESTITTKESDTSGSSTTKDAGDEKSAMSDKTKDTADSDSSSNAATSKTKGDNVTSGNKVTPKTTASATDGGSKGADGSSSSSSTSSGGGSDSGGGSEG